MVNEAREALIAFVEKRPYKTRHFSVIVEDQDFIVLRTKDGATPEEERKAMSTPWGGLLTWLALKAALPTGGNDAP